MQSKTRSRRRLLPHAASEAASLVVAAIAVSPRWVHSFAPSTTEQRRACQTTVAVNSNVHRVFTPHLSSSVGDDEHDEGVAADAPDYFADYDEFINDLELSLDDDDNGAPSPYADVGDADIERQQQDVMQQQSLLEPDGAGEALRDEAEQAKERTVREFAEVGAAAGSGALHKEGDGGDEMKGVDGRLPDPALMSDFVAGNGEDARADGESDDDYDAFLDCLERNMKEGRRKELMARREENVDGQELDGSPDDEHRDYRRDIHDPKTKLVDEAAVEELVGLRNKARKRGDFGLADELRDELITNHGVYVWDKDRIWTTNPIPPALRNRGRPSNKITLNRHDHDYTQVGGGVDPDKCNLSPQEINDLLAKLTHYELAKDFNLANAVRTKLIAGGVKIENRTKQWRADGGSFQYVDAPSTRIYTQSEYSAPVDDETQSKILASLRERAEAKKVRDFDRSDDIEEELYELYDVVLDHRDKTWRIATPYEMSSLSLPLPNPEDENDVRALLSDRFRATRARDYKLANFIRHHLNDAYDVTVDDKRMQWSVGGNFDTVGALDRPELDEATTTTTTTDSRPLRRFTMRDGPGDLSPKDVALVEALVSKRSQYLAGCDWTAADAIREVLLSKFNVRVDDLNQEFFVGAEGYAHSSMQKGLPADVEEARGEIERLIKERSQARVDRDFGKADRIRHLLSSKFGVRLDDRTKEWYCLEDESDGTVDKGQKDGTDLLLEEQEATAEGDVVGDAQVDTMTSEFLATLTIPQLKERLREAGLPLGGRKADLIERLLGN